jgi:hypothetical protein
MSMAGNYPSADFEIVDEGGTRKVLHLPTGMLLATGRSRADPIAVSADYTLLYDGNVVRPGEIVQAALRHLRVWLMRNYSPRGKSASRT